MESAVLRLLIAFVAAAAAGEPSGTFTDVMAESGVAEVIRAHYRNVPKWWLSGFDLIDLDGDGDLDLHVAGHGSPAAAAWNDGAGHFTYVDPKLAVPRGVRQDADIPYPGGEVRLAHDFDEDGKIDLHCSWHDGGGVLYLNASRAGKPPAWNFRRSHRLDHFNRATAMADLNGDGVADYLANAGGRRDPDPKVLLLAGKGDGTFAARRLLPGGLRESGAIPIDLDGDGDLDLLVSQRGYNPPGRRILANDGKGRFADVTAAAGLDARGGSIHGAGDIDHDGDPDLICVEGPALAIYLNDGRGRFTPKPDAISAKPGGRLPRGIAKANWGGAVVTDLDNDGLADVLVNGRYFLFVLRGTGGGTFRLANASWRLPARSWSAVDEGLCFGDLDGDGDLDVIACGRGPDGKQKGLAVLRNDLPRRGWVRVRPIGRRGNRAAGGAKIRIYAAGGLGEAKSLLWYEQVALWGRQSFHSYYTAAVTERHFGLGARRAVDVSVEFHPSGRRVERRSVRSGQTVVIREE